MTSSANVEIVRRLYEAVATHDAKAVLAFYDPEVEWDMSRGPLAGLTASGVYRGHEGLRRFFRERYEDWDEIEDVCDELIEAGEQVVSVTTTHGRGRSSGIELEATNATVWTLRDGRIVRGVWFGSREVALEEARLDLVRGLFVDVAAWMNPPSERRLEDLHAAFASYVADDVVYEEDPVWPDASTFRGCRAVAERIGEYAELMHIETAEPGEAVRGAERYYQEVGLRMLGGDAEDQSLAFRWGYTFEIEAERIARMRAWFDPDEGRRAAGL